MVMRWCSANDPSLLGRPRRGCYRTAPTTIPVFAPSLPPSMSRRVVRASPSFPPFPHPLPPSLTLPFLCVRLGPAESYVHVLGSMPDAKLRLEVLRMHHYMIEDYPKKVDRQDCVASRRPNRCLSPCTHPPLPSLSPSSHSSPLPHPTHPPTHPPHPITTLPLLLLPPFRPPCTLPFRPPLQLSDASKVLEACDRMCKSTSWRRLLHQLLLAGNCINMHRPGSRPMQAFRLNSLTKFADMRCDPTQQELASLWHPLSNQLFLSLLHTLTHSHTHRKFADMRCAPTQQKRAPLCSQHTQRPLSHLIPSLPSLSLSLSLFIPHSFSLSLTLILSPPPLPQDP
jgi:hypothetical protein